MPIKAASNLCGEAAADILWLTCQLFSARSLQCCDHPFPTLAQCPTANLNPNPGLSGMKVSNFLGVGRTAIDADFGDQSVTVGFSEFGD